MKTYEELAHAIQTGVAYEHAKGSPDGSPKHLRTGLNCVMQDHASLAGLLIAKGIITHEEYKAALLEGLQREVSAYEQRLSRDYNVNITLA